jgi:cytidylate kinase
MIITIDGPAGSGKSTVAAMLAGRLGACFLDTGAMYRAVTVAAMQGGVDLADEGQLVGVLRENDFEFTIDDDLTRAAVNGCDVTDDIRRPDVTANVKYIASAPALRAGLVEMQRRLAGEYEKIVTEGRDQGTVAFSDADFKFFLSAGAAERARRRQVQLGENGIALGLDKIQSEIEKRDKSDESREVGPLTPADDAIIIDTTEMNAEGVVEKMLSYISGKC